MPTGSKAQLQQPPHLQGAAVFTAPAQNFEPGEAGREDGVKEALTYGGSTQHRFSQEQESEVVANTAHGAGEPASSSACVEEQRAPGACSR